MAIITAAPTRSRESTFPLGSVRLLDSDFKNAQDVGLRYVLELNPDRLCAPYLKEAGLSTSAAVYAGWESDGLAGHIGGHYLSACAQLYAATGDPRLLERVHYVLGVFEQCQAASGDGYLGGVPGGRALGQELAAGDVDADLFTLNRRWVPLYNLHKTFAGLLDAHTYAGAASLNLLTGLADWWLSVSKRLSGDVFEEILQTEFGGMNETFTSLALLTGRSDYLQEAHRFAHRALLEPLSGGRDELDGLHANTQIPKVVGYERLARATGNEAYTAASDFFWRNLTQLRTVSIGGNSVREHFHPAHDFTPMILDPQGPETCNTYNMLKLAKLRFKRTGDPAALDYYERATYNHILSSQHPGRGGFVYFTAMRPAHYRVYSVAHESMWCCVGSGMENHARYGELIYSRTGTDLSVNLYIPSELQWAERGLQIRLVTDFPRSDVATLQVTADKPTEFTLRLRRPSWAVGMDVHIDGSPAAISQPHPEAGQDEEPGYVSVSRLWAGTTVVTVRLAAALRTEGLPDGSPWVSFLYGPVVLAGRDGQGGVDGFEALEDRMGHVASGPQIPLSRTPVITATNPADAVVLSDRTNITAQLAAVSEGVPVTVRLEPFAGIHDERYTLYWPTGASARQRSAELATLDAQGNRAQEAIDTVAAGEQQPEADHFFVGEGSRAGGRDGVHWRSATGWFSYTLKDPDGEAATLRLQFRPDADRAHEVRLNTVLLAEATVSHQDDDHVVVDFPIPEEARSAAVDGTIVFALHAIPGASTGDLLSVQLLKNS